MTRAALTFVLSPLLLAAEPIPASLPSHVEVSVDGSLSRPVRRSTALHFQVEDSRRPVVFHYTGHDSLTLDAEGNLLITAAGDTFVQESPAVFQRIGQSIRLVSAEYSISSTGEVLLRLGPHDRTRPLEIDAKLASPRSSAPSARAAGPAVLD